MGYEYKGVPIGGMIIRRFRSENNEIFVISDTFFRYRYASKDYSKFVFHGKELNKGRLVNAVIQSYVEQQPQTSYADFKQAFPDAIQGNYGVFALKVKAEELYQQSGHKRYYTDPDKFIPLNDETIATCTQWNPKNINSFINRARELGMKIEVK